MTGGQTALFAGEGNEASRARDEETTLAIDADRPPLKVIAASVEEASAHEDWLELLDGKSEAGAVWRRLEQA